MIRRREFLRGAIAGSTAWIGGCGTRPGPPPPGEPRIVRLEEGDGVYRLLNADREPFFCLGARMREETTLEADTPGADDQIERLIADLEAAGFNCVDDARADPSLFRERIHFIARPDTLRNDDLSKELIDVNETYPDLYHPNYFGEARWLGRQAVYYGYGSEKVIGLVLGPSPRWSRTEGDRLHPWVEAMRELDGGTAGKRRWIGTLRERHASASEAAEVYGTSDDDWEDLAWRTEWPEIAGPEAARKDAEAFLQVLAERWYRPRAESARRTDPRGTLVLSDRIQADGAPDWLYPIVSRHVDVLYLDVGEGSDPAADRLRAIHAASGKPVLVVGSTSDGAAYAAELERTASLPFVVGRIELGAVPLDDPRVVEANDQAAAWHDASNTPLP